MKIVNLSQLPKNNLMITRVKDCVIITLYDNIVELERDEEINYSAEMERDEEINYSAEMYQLKTAWRDNRVIDYDEWLAIAKRLENPITVQDQRLARDMLV